MVAGAALPMWSRDVLCMPAALAAAFWLGTPIDFDDGGYPVLLRGDAMVRVGPECSALEFLALVYGLAVAQVLRPRSAASRPSVTMQMTGWLLGAWGITVGVNTLRILAVVMMRGLAPILPANDHLTHLGIGVLIFLPSLLVLNLLIEKAYEYRPSEPSEPGDGHPHRFNGLHRGGNRGPVESARCRSPSAHGWS
jgi:exosortase/archaeosortase family protein